MHHKISKTLYVFNTCNKSQYDMTKLSISINRHKLYQCIFQSFFLNHIFSKSVRNPDDVYIILLFYVRDINYLGLSNIISTL